MPEYRQLLRKIPGGKLLRISCVTNDAIIQQISIRGDFFMYPEESVFDIESHLCPLLVSPLLTGRNHRHLTGLPVPGTARDDGLAVVNPPPAVSETPMATTK